MSKRPLPGTSTGGPNRKKSSCRRARNSSEVVASSTKVGQLASGRVKQTKQNTSLASSSMIAAQVAPLLHDDVMWHVRIWKLYDTARLCATMARVQTARVRSKQLSILSI